MLIEVKKYLYDMLSACRRIAEFTAGKSYSVYSHDALLRSAVERQLEIVGEALARLTKVDRTIAEKITDHRQIIAFRNILVHAYAQIDDRLVWGSSKRACPP
jgi:uncharacterized protein with HEPN domain